MITLIAAIGRNGELGYNNTLLCSIPEDMKHFKAYTMGKVVIMGRKTYASIGSKPLPGRKCIVVSTSDLHEITAHSIDDALSIEHCYPELVVIGGESIYRQTIDRADKLVITHIDADFIADAYFPDIDPNKWKINKSVASSDDKFNYSFVEYVRNEANRNTD